jgi:hypothetical protein
MKQLAVMGKILPLMGGFEATSLPQQGTHQIEQAIAAKAPVDGELASPTAPLSENEHDVLQQCEEILEKGLRTFFEVGNALLRIRQARLYRATHSTFEQYCHERWNMGRSYAWRVIGAAERLKLLPSDNNLPRPANEFQIRPFLKIAPEEFPKAWKRAVRTAKEGKVTPSIAQEVIHRLLPDALDQVRVVKRARRNKSRGKLPLGHILVLLNETKRSVEKGETEKALAALANIEGLLCGV